MNKQEYKERLKTLAQSDPGIALYYAMYTVKGEEIDWLKQMPDEVAKAYADIQEATHEETSSD